MKVNSEPLKISPRGVMTANDVIWAIDPMCKHKNKGVQEIIDYMGGVKFFFRETDKRPPIIQAEEGYQFPLTKLGGSVSSAGIYQYPQDPDQYPLAMSQLNGAYILFYDHAITAFCWAGSDGSILTVCQDITRLD